MRDFDLQGIGMTSRRTRDRLVRRLRKAGIADERVLDTIAAVPRHIFVDEALAHRAYEDSALPIGHGQTISQPYLVAAMTAAVINAAGDAAAPRQILEIGTGSGYQRRSWRAVSGSARSNASADCCNAPARAAGLDSQTFVSSTATGNLGGGNAPFDAVMVTAGAFHIRRRLDQMADAPTL